jgi:1-acyl-sn-glycerol-3-phosphate acyltransferase
MVVLRSLAFNIAIFLNFLLFGALLLPRLLGSDRTMLNGVKGWNRANLWLLKHIAGLDLEFRGLDRVPPGPLLIVSKHQSALETFALVPALDFPSFVLKRELMQIPFFGWYARKSGMIPIDRTGRSAALHQMVETARAVLAEGRQIVIFPEGTRTAPGAPPSYKLGAAYLYAELDATVVPVALNTGLFWPRRSFIKHPGRAVIEFLEPIPPGMKRTAFLPLLEQRIETATARLVEEALRQPS